VKFSAFIIAIIVSVQCFVPCADPIASLSNGKSVSIMSQASGQQENERADDCSPFCHCTCCAGLTVVQHPTLMSYQKDYNVISYTTYISSSTVEIAYPIFQPSNF